MKIVIHLPRHSEAEIEPNLRTDLQVKPRFYKRSGLVPVFYFTTIDGKGHEERHVMLVNAANKRIVVEKLVEVIPACDMDEDNKKAKKNSEVAEDESTDGS